MWSDVASRRLARVKTCLLDSLGAAAYYEGAALGEYQLGEGGVYRQKGSGTFVLSNNQDGCWEVEHTEGYVPFICPNTSPVPPKSSWSFRRGKGTIYSLRLRDSQDSQDSGTPKTPGFPRLPEDRWKK